MVQYWFASHITGLFSIHNQHEDILMKGSRGAGFSISRGTSTKIELSSDNKNHIFFNNEEVTKEKATITNFVLEYIERLDGNEKEFGVSIFHEFEVPLSSGFGASASGALGTAFCLNDFFRLGYSEKQLYQLAHKAEIVEGGGLGDVIAIRTGGWEYRIKEGAPFIGEAHNILKNGYKVATISFGDISTKSVIKNENWIQKINSVGDLFLSEFLKNPTITNFGIAAKQFSVSSLLATPEVIDFMNKYDSDKLLIGQIMLGNGVFIIYKNLEDLPKIENIVLEEICHSTMKKID